MKIVCITLLTVLSTLTSLASADDGPGTFSLLEFSENSLSNRSAMPKLDLTPRMLTNTNRNCVNEKLKLTYGIGSDRQLASPNIVTATLFATLLCFDDLSVQLDEEFDTDVKKFVKPELRENVDCFKLRLYQIEGESKLLEGFNPRTVDISSPGCRKAIKVIRQDKELMDNLKEGKDMYQAACGTKNAELFLQKFLNELHRYAIIANGEYSEQVILSQKEMHRNYSVKHMNEVLQCIIN